MLNAHVTLAAHVFKPFFAALSIQIWLQKFRRIKILSRYNHALIVHEKSWHNLLDAIAICILTSRFSKDAKLVTIALIFTAKAHRWRFPRVDVETWFTRGTLCCHFDQALEFTPTSQSATFLNEINWGPILETHRFAFGQTACCLCWGRLSSYRCWKKKWSWRIWRCVPDTRTTSEKTSKKTDHSKGEVCACKNKCAAHKVITLRWEPFFVFLSISLEELALVK